MRQVLTWCCRPCRDLHVCGDRQHVCCVMCCMQGVASSLASGLAGAAVEAEQACYLPLSEDGLPVIGRCVGGCFVEVWVAKQRASGVHVGVSMTGFVWHTASSCAGVTCSALCLVTAGCRALMVCMWHRGTAAGVSSTDLQRARRWRS